MDSGDDATNQLLHLNRSGEGKRGGASSGNSKSKRIKIGAVVGVVLIAVTIIIIVATKGGGGDDPDPGPDPGPGPGPNPPVPPTPGVYNPYQISESSNDGKQIKGFLSVANHVAWTHEERTAYKKSISPNDVGLLDPRVIQEGPNNQLI